MQKILFLLLLGFSFNLHATQVYTLEIKSSALQRKVKIAVVTPKTYSSGQNRYPSLGGYYMDNPAFYREHAVV